MFNGYLSLCYILTKCAYVCVHVCVCVCMCAGSSLLHRIFSSCCELGLLFIVIQGLLIAVASLVEHGLQALRLQQLHRLSCCNFQAPELGPVVVVHGLIASQHVGSSWTRNRSNLHLLQWHETLIHCANREVPCVCTFLMYLTVSHSLAYLLHLAKQLQGSTGIASTICLSVLPGRDTD